MDKQDIEDTRNSLSADQKFLMNLKETCQMSDAEYEERVKSRQEEIKACGEALAILTSDEAHSTFSRTFNFVQVSSKSKKKEEIKHKDFCTDALNTNEREQELKQRDIDELEAEIADLTTTIDELTKSIATLTSEIAEMQTQLKRAGEDREKENADFQTTGADQRATQALLTKALDVLKGVYAKKELMQLRSHKQPAGFKKYEKSGGAGGVMGMIEQIIR